MEHKPQEIPVQEMQTLKEPPLDKILFCNQGSFVYLKPNVPKQYEYLETIGLGPCVAFVLRDSKADLTVMAHLDAWRGFNKSVYQVLSYLKSKQLTSGEFDQAWVIGSQQADKKNIDEVANVLKGQASKVFVKTTGWTNAIIVNRAGEIFNVTDIKPGHLFETKLDELEMQARSALLCANEVLEEKIRLEKAKEYDNEGLPQELQDEGILPSLNRKWHMLSASGYGAYGVRIKSNSSKISPLVNKLAENEGAVLRPFAPIQKLQIPNSSPPLLTIAMEQHTSGDFYYEISGQGYKYEQDREIVQRINEIAAQIWQVIQKQH